MLRSLSIFAVAIRLLIDYLWLDFRGRFQSDAARRRAEERAFHRWGRLIRRTALRLHGLIIKVGQFLSARADVLPESFTRELSALQDAVPPAPFAAIRRRVEGELGASLDAVFAEIEPQALASASLGQVHRARLKDGQTVAVKVLRPGIERLVAIDMAALRRILRFLERRTSWGHRFDLPAIMTEFETITYREMDYRLEAENIRTFRKHFAGVAGIDVPVPLDHLVSEKLLVMEFKAGVKLTERERLLAQGLAPSDLAERLIEAYLKQILIDGFVHVDPHPGNLLVDADGDIVFIDFGMVATVTADDRTHFTSLVTTLVARDLDGAVRALDSLGFLRRGAETGVLKQALGMLVDHFSGIKLTPGPEMDRFLMDFREWLYEEPLQFPARYLFLGRAVGLLAGLASGLDPAIDWTKVLKDRALPLLGQARAAGAETGGEGGGFDWRATLTDLFGPGAVPVVDLVLKQAAATGMSLVRLPGQLERVLGQVESGSVQVRADLSGLTERMDRQNHLVSRLAWAVLAAGAGVTGAILRTGGAGSEARIAWGGGALAVLALLVNLMRSGSTGGGRRRRRPPHRRFSER